MIHFRNDYNDIAHPKLIEHLLKHQDECHLGYGMDNHSKHAKELIQKHSQHPIFYSFYVWWNICEQNRYFPSFKAL